MEIKILDNNILVGKHPANGKYFENSCRAVGPGPTCPKGKIVVVIGQPRKPEKILHRPLLDANDSFDLTSVSGEQPFQLGAPTRSGGTDNQIVRLKDGSLLAEKDSYVWDDITKLSGDKPVVPPPWYDEIIDGGGGLQKGQRGCPVFCRSTNCGTSWQPLPPIDFALVEGGKYAYPQIHSDPTKQWWVGGADRTEMYACPFTGNVYLTTSVTSGPYPKNNTPKLKVILLFFSTDKGQSWKLIKELPPGVPLVMTSTPNGRLFLFQSTNPPLIYYSKLRVAVGQIPEISPGYPVHYVENGTNVPCLGPTPVAMHVQVPHQTISRISTAGGSSKVRVAYQSQNEWGMQESRIVNIDVQDQNAAPVLTPVTTIRAEDPRHYSVMFTAFIDPDYVDMPPEVKTNASLLYWIEAPRTLSSSRKYAIRCAMFEGETKHTSPMYLSVKNGAPRRWNWPSGQSIGDYMTGGFFWTPDTLNYVAQWVEPEGIKANIVTTPYPFLLPPLWRINIDGFDQCAFTIDNITPDGNFEGRIIDAKTTDYVKGFWADGWEKRPEAGARKITFTRHMSNPPAGGTSSSPHSMQIYTGYLLPGEPILTGTFEAFKGSGATAKRSVFGWMARPLYE